MNAALMRFSSTIKLVDNNTFKNQVRGYPKITEYKGDNIITSRNAFTDGIIMCNSGGINYKNRVLLFHFFPDSKKNNKRLVNELEKKHKPKKNSCRGLLVGGDSFYPTSSDLKTILIALFKRLEIPFSIIWGRNTNTLSSVAYAADKDTWFVNVHPANQENNSILSVGSLKKEFEDIRIDDGDELST